MAVGPNDMAMKGMLRPSQHQVLVIERYPCPWWLELLQQPGINFQVSFGMHGRVGNVKKPKVGQWPAILIRILMQLTNNVLNELWLHSPGRAQDDLDGSIVLVVVCLENAAKGGQLRLGKEDVLSKGQENAVNVEKQYNGVG